MMLWLSLSPKFNWGSSTVSAANTDFKKMGPLIHEVFSSWGCYLSLSSYHMTLNGILLSNPCCSHCICSEILDERQKRVCRTAGLSLTGPLELSAHRQNVTSWTLFYSYYFGQCSFKMVELIPNPHSRGRYTRYSNILKSSHLS